MQTATESVVAGRDGQAWDRRTAPA